jgi:hypothetical protein
MHDEKAQQYKDYASGKSGMLPAKTPGGGHVIKKSQPAVDLHDFLVKAGIPGAADTSEGKGPYDDLPSGEPSMEPGEDVNGPMLSLDGMGANTGGPGSGPAKGAEKIDTGKNTQLSEDDPDQAGEMKQGEPGMKAGPPEMPASAINAVDAGKDIIKGMTLEPTREDLTYGMRKSAFQRQAGRVADVTAGVGRPSPKQALEPAPQATTWAKGFTRYTDAADLAVEKAMKGDGFYQNGSPTLGTQGSLIKSMGCPACSGSMPAWASRCPECGYGIGETLQKSAAPVIRAPGIRPRETADLHLPGGVRRK